jgi:hypothetical protein
MVVTRVRRINGQKRVQIGHKGYTVWVVHRVQEILVQLLVFQGGYADACISLEASDGGSKDTVSLLASKLEFGLTKWDPEPEGRASSDITSIGLAGVAFAICYW